MLRNSESRCTKTSQTLPVNSVSIRNVYARVLVSLLFKPSKVHSFCKFELVFALTTMYLSTLKADFILCIYIAVTTTDVDNSTAVVLCNVSECKAYVSLCCGLFIHRLF